MRVSRSSSKPRCSRYAYAGSGISVGSGSNVIDNTVRENGGTGLALATGTRYAGNVVQGNGATVSDGVDTGTNVCNGVLGCP